MADITTGGGSTIGFDQGITWASPPNVTRIGGLQKTLEALENFHLGHTGNKRYAPADLADLEEIVMGIRNDFTNMPPIDGAIGDLTVTNPAGDTLEVSGFLSRDTGASLANNEVTEGEMGFHPDGESIVYAAAP